MGKAFCSLLMAALASAGAHATPMKWHLATTATKLAPPAHLQQAHSKLPPEAVVSLVGAAAPNDESWQLPMPDGESVAVEAVSVTHHPNGDVTHAGTVRMAGALYPVLLTVGREAGFGTWRTPHGEFSFESWGARGYLVDMAKAGISYEPIDRQPPATAAARPAAAPAPKGLETTVDVMFLYSPGIAARYPGEALQTRINHLVAVANQAMADSAIPVVLRLVAIDATDYADTGKDTGTASAELRATLDGSAEVFPGLRERRTAVGADVVALLRAYDRYAHGVCGAVERYPDGNPAYGALVAGDGEDGWRRCSDYVFTHELGHVFGAGHELNLGGVPPATAFIAPGRFQTVMGENALPRLLRFSDPNALCGGAACGEAGSSDNAQQVRDYAQTVAGYAAAVSTVAVTAPAPLDPDVDGDGIPESQDAFPFDAGRNQDSDGDGVADPEDAFPADPAEWADTDGDGVGDNADDDDDGDGVSDSSDAFPLDATETVDTDGDGVGDNADAFPQDPAEFRDTDADGIGDVADTDADGDGADDFADGATPAGSDLLVISSGTDRLLRFDGDSGLFAGVELARPSDRLAFGRHADLAWNADQDLLYVTMDGGVSRYERHDPSSRRVYLSRADFSLQSDFPGGIAIGEGNRLVVADASRRTLAFYDSNVRTLVGGGVFGWQPRFTREVREVEVSGSSAWAVQVNGEVVEGDVGTATRLRAANLSGLADVSDLAVSPDGSQLYLADLDSGAIWKTGTATLSQPTLFVPAGSGGLNGPAALAFGPDGHLYVSSLRSDQVLRYDGTSGAFIDVFTQAPPGVLDAPRELAFAPRVKDRYPRDPERQLRPVPGGWYNPARSGHGIEMQRAGSSVGLIWYTYESDGTPTWYLAPATELEGNSWSAPLLRFTWDGTRALAESVGTATLQFDDERTAQFGWTLPGSTGSEPIRVLLGGTTSETQFPTGAWYPPGESGWGLTVTRQGETAYAIAFIYDPAGQPTWVAGSAPAADRLEIEVSVFSGPTRCPACTGSANPTLQPAGTLVFDVQGFGEARVDTGIAADGLQWQRDGSDFARLTDTPTQQNGDPLP